MPEPSHDFGHDRILQYVSIERTTGPKTYFEVSQRDAVLGIKCFAQEEIPETELASFHFEFFDDRYDRLPPSCIIRQLCPGQSLRGPDLLLKANGKRYEEERWLLRDVSQTSRKVMSFARVSLA